MIRTIKKAIAVLLAACFVLYLPGCGRQTQNKNSENVVLESVCNEFDSICDDYVHEVYADDCSPCFVFKEPSKYGFDIEDSDFCFEFISLEKYLHMGEVDQTYKKKFETVDYDSLDEDRQDKYSHLMSMIEWTECTYTEDMYYIQNYLSVNNGMMMSFLDTMRVFSIDSQEDVEHYLSLEKSFAECQEGFVEYARERARRGLLHEPKNFADLIELYEEKADSGLQSLIDDFEKKLAQLDLSDAKLREYGERNRSIISDSVIPAIRKTAGELEKLMPLCKDKYGICSYGDNGKKLYESKLKCMLGRDISVKEYENYILEKNNDIQSRIVDILDNSFSLYSQLSTYKTGFDNARSIIEFILDKMEEDFPEPVTDKYTLEEFDKSMEGSGTAASYFPSRVGDVDNNVILINSEEVANEDLQSFQTVAHESLPGHMYQNTYDVMNAGDDFIVEKTMALAVSEGWAQFASMYSMKYLDADEKLLELYRLMDNQSRAVYVLAGICANYYGMDMQDTIDYISECTGQKQYADAVVKSEYYTITDYTFFLDPYVYGYLQYEDMYNKAAERLGESFDDKEFFAFILDSRYLNFDILDSRLDEWIRLKK